MSVTRRRVARAGVAAACVLLPCGCAAIVGIGDITAPGSDGGSQGDESPDSPGPGPGDEGPGLDSSTAAETGPDEAGPDETGLGEGFADDAPSFVETGSPGDTGADSMLAESGVPEASPEAGPPTPDAGHPDAGPDASNACPSVTTQTLATSLTVNVGWPSTTTSNTGTGSISMLLLTPLTGSTSLTGTSRMCAMKVPDLVLNAIGGAATGTSSGTKVQLPVSNATWDQITRTFAVAGTQAGLDPNDALNVSPWVSLFGLTSASGYGSDATAWPAACATGTCTPAGSFTAASLQDDDNDSFAGITVLPSTATGYTLPATSTVFSQLADRLYIVFRTEVALTETRVSCTASSGTATVSLFDSHVVGCHVTAGSSSAAGPCSSDQVQFLDDTRTVYGFDSSSGDVISKAHPVVGTAATISLAAGATCAQARAAFSPTFN